MKKKRGDRKKKEMKRVGVKGGRRDSGVKKKKNVRKKRNNKNGWNREK